MEQRGQGRICEGGELLSQLFQPRESLQAAVTSPSPTAPPPRHPATPPAPGQFLSWVEPRVTRTSTTALRQREKGGNVQRDRGRKRERGRKCMRRRWKTTEQRGDRARRKGMRVGDRERQRERERKRENQLFRSQDTRFTVLQPRRR